MSSLADPPALAGTWALSRTIDDRAGRQRSRVDGLLVLTVHSATRVRWEERGIWSRTGGEVRRTLLVEHGTDGWWVHFEDARAFHAWRPDEQVLHVCGDDTYRGLIAGSPRQWTVRWEVHGPKKDYTMVSLLTPPSV